jgi:hypothetical protein
MARDGLVEVNGGRAPHVQANGEVGGATTREGGQPLAVPLLCVRLQCHLQRAAFPAGPAGDALSLANLRDTLRRCGTANRVRGLHRHSDDAAYPRAFELCPWCQAISTTATRPEAGGEVAGSPA